MSNVSNSHNVQKLEKNSKALSGQRMARVIAKKGKTGEYENPNLVESKFVSIPLITEFSAEQLNALKPHIIGLVMNAQDAIIRERIITDGVSSIHNDEIGIDKCIAYLDDEAKGNRVTGAYLQQWFIDAYYESAAEFVCVNAKFDPNNLSQEQIGVIEKKVNVLRDMFAGFASPRYKPEIPQCKAMMKFGEFLSIDNQDARMANFVEKAAKVKKEREEEMSMDALGF